MSDRVLHFLDHVSTPQRDPLNEATFVQMRPLLFAQARPRRKRLPVDREKGWYKRPADRANPTGPAWLPEAFVPFLRYPCGLGL